jgi:hypothetical protein
VRATKGALVSEPYGSLTFAEVPGWVAWVIKDWTPWGKNTGGLYLRMSERVDTKNIPAPIKAQVRLRR